MLVEIYTHRTVEDKNKIWKYVYIFNPILIDWPFIHPRSTRPRSNDKNKTKQKQMNLRDLTALIAFV